MVNDAPGQVKRPLGKKRIPFMAAILFFAMLFFGMTAFAAQAEGNPLTVNSDNPHVSMDIVYGYDNAAKGGRYLPVRISVMSDLGYEVPATLKIRLEESDGAIYEYDFPLTIAEAGQTQVTEYIPLGTRTTQLYVCLADGSGAIITEQLVNLNVSWDVPELFIGILSDNPNDLTFLDGVGIDYGLMRTRTFELVEEDISTDEEELDQLDVLVVNDYRLSAMSDGKISSIMTWVYNGGVLLIGTGARVDDTLGILSDELLDSPYDSPSLYHIDLSESYPMENQDAGMLAVMCVNLSLHGGNIVISSDNLGLLSVANKERGLIGVSAFDLSELTQFCESEPAYVDFFLTSLIGEDRIRDLAQVVYSGNSDYYTSIQALINTGNVEKLPNLTLYVILIVIYLLILGPGMYLFLRHRNLQNYYRRGVLILAFVFVVIIYLVGSATRFRSTFYTYATILDSMDGYVTDTTYVNIRNPYNRTFEVSLDPDYAVLPITRSQRNMPWQNTGITVEDDYQIRIEQLPDRTLLTAQSVAAFSPRYFELKKRNSNEEGEGISGEISYFDGVITGWIKNDYSYTLENIAVILYGNLVTIENIEPGEIKELDDLTVLSFPLNASQIVAEYITGQSSFAYSDIGNTEYLRAMKRAAMLQFYMDNYMMGYTADAKIIAFSQEKEDTSFLVQSEGDTYGITMLTSSISVASSRNGQVYRSVLMKTPVVVTGEYNARNNTMNGALPLTLEYQLGTDLLVEDLTFRSVSDAFTGIGDERDQATIFSGSMYLYNHITGSYDKLDTVDAVLSTEDLRPYLSPGNILTVRYIYEGTGSLREIELPMPMVTGRSF